ncbi:7-cyano-7-deazaguanine synthase [Bhargavaea cecembensis DSE10]|uniref:7-cyano-7-deazaguanine synthase n=1 Tax=Bhargavaea cecembensis DSE10 TaxID=1235279 RepID=M7NF48_9BACL|nr:7-cyano-7-deazaguanine synthase QueC [Bhargavaea cecembensis]EMR07183.1 7-cyano-7-deazaguanine synthase [Bhargavaea cecembensis DSE10]
MKQEKAVVVFSGGQDSTTCLFWAMENFSEVEAVTFDYGQRHALEVECAKDIAEELGVKHHILDMSLIGQLAPNALTDTGIEVADGEDGGLPSTFVPGRNLLFFSFAGILARQIGAKHIVTGVSETDFSGYPDCRDAFVKSLNVTLNLAMDGQFVIHTPLMWLDKSQVWELSDQLGKLDYVRTKTLTCYNGIQADGCGECPACRLRRKGLETYVGKKGGTVLPDGGSAEEVALP